MIICHHGWLREMKIKKGLFTPTVGTFSLFFSHSFLSLNIFEYMINNFKL